MAQSFPYRQYKKPAEPSPWYNTIASMKKKRGKFMTLFKSIVLMVISCSVMLSATACSQNQEENEKQQTVQESTEKAVVMEQATPEKIKNVIIQSLGYNQEKGEQKISDVVIDHDDHIMITFNPDANASGNLLPFTIQQDISNILWGIKKSNLKVTSVQLIATQTTTDQSEIIVPKEIVNVTYSIETIKKIDFESMNTDNMLSLADTTSYLEPGLVNK